MYILLAQEREGKYRGIDRICKPYRNAKISLFGKTDRETKAAWEDYLDLCGVPELIGYSEDAVQVMGRVIGLSAKNSSDMEIILYTDDPDELPAREAAFLGYDIAGSWFTSLLGKSFGYHAPERYMDGVLNEYGLFGVAKHALALCGYVNALRDNSVEPEFPYLPIKVYTLGAYP